MDGLDKDVRKLIRVAKKAGWDVTWTGSTHILLTSPGGTSKVTLTNSGSNKGRRLNNMRAECRRAGLSV